MRKTATRRALTLCAGFAATALLVSGCTGGGNEGSTDEVSQEEIDEALSTPTELVFWTWVGGIEEEVALFEEAYPEIDVTVENVGQGGAHYSTMRTALEAGQGLPDVVQMEYQYISSFTLTDSLLDLAPYGAADLAGDFEEWVWNQVRQGDGIYAVPQDSGPMGNLYRADILEAAGWPEAPTTWVEFAEAAQAVRDSGDSYITNLAPNDPGALVGLLWQAGVKPFGYDGDQTVTIDLASDGAKETMAYWQDLIDADLVSVDPDFTDGWYQGLANGRYAGWLTAAWGPLFLQGTAGDTSGLWRSAPLPEWTAGTPAAGNWGGSSSAVLAESDNPIAAYELAKFINSERESAVSLATTKFLFPTTVEVLGDDAFLSEESEFYGGQRVNELFAEISGTVDTEFEWLPFMDFVYSSFEGTLGAAIAEKGDLSAGLDAWQQEVVDYANQQGFTVE